VTAASGAAPLPRLRGDLRLFEGAASADGAPGWTLHDPVRGRYFRLGPEAFALIGRWGLGDRAAVLRAVAADTVLRPTAAQLDELVGFLRGNDLVEAEDAAAVAQRASAAECGRGRWLVHRYLFFRVPLVRPDRALARLAPLAAPLYSRAAPWAVLLCGLLGLMLAARQWDAFLQSAAQIFGWSGVAGYALALLALKTCHELGHAITAKRFGCRVPTMGVAFLVLFPVLYTDTSDAWRLRSRRARLAIAGAGIVTELALAALATLAWSFLPDGPLRSAAFFVATTAWLLTLLVNLNPFMRFDGYYLLSDWLGVDNLQPRAFALARWRLREAVFGFGEPAPEPFPKRRRAFLLAYAYATWAYRLVLFVSIALFVYALTFKLLGIVLFAVEIAWFVCLPILRELGEWWRRRRAVRVNASLLLSVAALCGLAGLAFVPWQSSLALPAVLRAADTAELYAPVPARIAEVRIAAGERVEAGQILLDLASPELDHALAQEERRIAQLQHRMLRLAASQEAPEDLGVLQGRLAEALASREGLRERREALVLRAPFAGRVADLADGAAAGGWVGPERRLALLVAEGGARLVGYVGSRDRHRLAPGRPAVFHPDDPLAPRIEAVASEIDPVNLAALDTPFVAARYGGGIAVRPREDRLVPVETVYRAAFEPAAPLAAPPRILRGVIRVESEAESLAGRAWRRIAAVAVRESGF
jgi:putative peptide zinc metalloprotease protein